MDTQANLIRADVLRMKRIHAGVTQRAIAQRAGVTQQSIQNFEASSHRRKYKSAKRDAIIEAYEHLDELRPYTSADLITGRWLNDQIAVFVRESAVEARGVPDGHVLIPSEALFDLGRRIVLATKTLEEVRL